MELPGADKIEQPEFAALLHEFRHSIGAYLAALPGNPPRSLAELIGFNQRNADLVLARFGQELFEQAEATGGDLTDPGYLALRADAARLARVAMETPLVTHRLDAVVALTACPAWLTDYVLGDHDVFHTSGPAAVGGYPAVSVPFGYVWGLPVGISFMGPRWSESRLIALAYAFEQAAATPGRQPGAAARHHRPPAPPGRNPLPLTACSPVAPVSFPARSPSRPGPPPGRRPPPGPRLPPGPPGLLPGPVSSRARLLPAAGRPASSPARVRTAPWRGKIAWEHGILASPEHPPAARTRTRAEAPGHGHR